MKLVDLKYHQGKLQVQRLNGPFNADLKRCLLLWLAALLFPALTGGVGDLVILWVIHTDGQSTIPMPMTSQFFLVIVVSVTLAFIASLLPTFQAMLSPSMFLLDVTKNTLAVNGRKVGKLSLTRLVLQDSFGPGPRALRLIILSERENMFIVAQTQRFGINYGGLSREYIGADRQERRQDKYWLGQWATYTGVKTGFNPAWPEYCEIFALYTSIKEYVETGKEESA